MSDRWHVRGLSQSLKRMPSPTSKSSVSASSTRPLRIGFIALNDSAPIIVAHEQGFFRQQGLQVELSREVGWATIRDKLVYRELDATHALGSMVISTTLGLNSLPCDCLTACVLSINGNCITLSEDLWKRGVRDAKTMRDEIIRSRHERTYVFGVVYAHSPHHIHLCDWLRSVGVDPVRDVRVVVVPPPQLFRNLAAGTIDGYCVSDPWNSLAVREQAGWCVATGAELSPNHPDKVFMVRSDFAEQRHEEHLAMIVALTKAAKLCDDPAFRPELVRLLARREYLNVPARVIQSSLVGPLDFGHGRTTPADEFISFHRNGANNPTPAKAAWLINAFNRHRFLPDGKIVPPDLAARAFRSDIFLQSSKSSSRQHDNALVHA